MKITELLSRESICLNTTAKNKSDVIDKMVSLMEKSGKILDRKNYFEAVLNREKEGTTGVGKGIAIPHGRCSSVKSVGLSAMTLMDGVDFNALDEKPVDLLFLIAAPEDAGSIHLEILSKLAALLMNDNFTSKLKAAKNVDEFISIIDEAEKEKDNESKVLNKDASKHLILAVTACPTGIAHTYMAQEAIEKAALKKGYDIKVETRGSGGTKNILTDDEIKKADGIIVAADTSVPMKRFDGKKVIECQVSKGISKADELIDSIINGDVAIYKSSSASKENQEEIIGVSHQIYKHLMNGVSHMLPFVVGGGILIALGFLVDSLTFDINTLSTAERANFGSLTMLSNLLKGKIGGLAFSFMLPILSGYIAMSIADRPGLAIGFVGGAIAANGTSGFLGAIVAGFIAGYFVNLLRKVCDKFLPASLNGMKPVLIYPLMGILIVGILMIYVIEPIVGTINIAMNNALASLSNTNVILLGLIVAGMMAIDMGGPFNKAAYVFGVASIASGNYNIMAAVMIGGMVPPCAIALSTILFKNKFTESERKSAPTSFVMGLAFITEGAIPYAAIDPIHVIPSCIIGSALAGALSMAFNCTLMAPHGGIFVFPVVGNAIMYIVALIIGSIVGAIILGIIKKPISK